VSKFSVRITERDERDWSEDDSLLALQTSPKPPPPQEDGFPAPSASISPLSDQRIEDEAAATPS
jgi:hypothetical protein